MAAPLLIKCSRCGRYYETKRYSEDCPHAYRRFGTVDEALAQPNVDVRKALDNASRQ